MENSVEVAGSSVEKPKHIVVLVHGIRTHASWAEMVAAVLESGGGVDVIPIRYGYFDIFRFLCPIGTRNAPVERILRELRDIRSDNPTADISVIAHSFGTYAMRRVLEEREIRLNRMILCGCIIAEDFRRADYRAQLGSDPILNDCGTHDIWPVMAKTITWGYGATGTFGFGTHGVRDRYNKFTHADYFDRAFVQDYWAPFIHDGVIRPTKWEEERNTPPWWQSVLAVFPLKYVALVVMMLGLSLGWRYHEDRKLVALGLGPDLSVGHVLGRPTVLTPVRLINETSQNVVVKDLELKVTSPTGLEVPMQMEGIVFPDQFRPALTLISARAGETIQFRYSFFNYSPEYLLLQQEVSNHSIRTSLIVNPYQPDETKEYIPPDLTQKLQQFAKSNFIWVPGTWTVSLSGVLQDGRKLSVNRHFELTEKEVEQMWNITKHYKSGIGVFPVWRLLPKGDYQPIQQKTFID